MRFFLPFKLWMRLLVFGKLAVLPLVFVPFAFPEALSSIWGPLPDVSLGLMIALGLFGAVITILFRCGMLTFTCPNCKGSATVTEPAAADMSFRCSCRQCNAVYRHRLSGLGLVREDKETE